MTIVMRTKKLTALPPLAVINCSQRLLSPSPIRAGMWTGSTLCRSCTLEFLPSPEDTVSTLLLSNVCLLNLSTLSFAVPPETSLVVFFLLIHVLHLKNILDFYCAIGLKMQFIRFSIFFYLKQIFFHTVYYDYGFFSPSSSQSSSHPNPFFCSLKNKQAPKK